MVLSVPPGIEPKRVSVDAIEHWMIYREHPERRRDHARARVGRRRGGHGDQLPVRHGRAGRGGRRPHPRAPRIPAHAVVGLKNHGLTITGSSLDEIFERVGPHLVRQRPHELGPGPPRLTPPARRTTGGVSWLVIAVSCTGVFLAYLDVTIVNVALPTIADDLGSGRPRRLVGRDGLRGGLHRAAGHRRAPGGRPRRPRGLRRRAGGLRDHLGGLRAGARAVVARGDAGGPGRGGRGAGDGVAGAAAAQRGPGPARCRARHVGRRRRRLGRARAAAGRRCWPRPTGGSCSG